MNGISKSTCARVFQALFFFLVFGATALSVLAREVPFRTSRDFAEPLAGALDLHAVDLDGDGDLDVAAAGYDASAVVWWENVAGSASQWTSHTVAQGFAGARSIASADLDGDGDSDLIGAAYADNQIAWWKNLQGDGLLWTSHTLSDDFGLATEVRGADIDRDGDIDVLGAASADDALRWWENDGSGASWTEHTIDGAFDGAYSLDVADFDSDGAPDVVGAARDADAIAWWKSAEGGRGPWARRIVDAAFDGAESVRAADVDGDGDSDIVAAAYYANTVAWWENVDGKGAEWFKHRIDAEFGGAWFVSVADVDGDGDTDALGAAWSGDAVAWWENVGGSGLDWSRHVVDDALDRAASAEAADLDGDGDLDLMAVANLEDRVAWWENRTIHRNALFVNERTIGPDFDGARSVALADVDGDGDTDILGAALDADRLAWWSNDSPTHWTERTIDTGIDGAFAIEAGDLDGDGDLDVVASATTSNDVAWWENTQGDGTLWSRHMLDGYFMNAQGIHLADVDGDGDLDVLGASANGNDIVWWDNPRAADALWTKRPIFTNYSGALDATTADLDGDGDLDAIGVSRYMGMHWFENDDGSGASWTDRFLAQNLTEFTSVEAADLDGDGDVDLATVAFYGEDVTWWENVVGNGRFWQDHTIATGLLGATSVRIVDMDGDGDPDVAGAGSYSRRLDWWENANGDASAWINRSVATRLWGTYDIRIGDLDGDGDADLAAATVADDGIRVWENRGGQLSLAASNSAPSAIREGALDDILRITASHRGRSGDADAEVVSLRLRFDDGMSRALTSAEANALFQSVRFYAAAGSGSFSPEPDALVARIDTLDLLDGEMSFDLPDDDARLRIRAADSGNFYIAALMTTTAASLPVDRFRIAHAPTGVVGSRGENAPYDLPLALQDAPAVASSLVRAVPGEPAAPAIVAEPAVSYGSINMVEWLPSAYATSYTAQCAGSPDFSSVVAAVDVAHPALSATFTGLTVGRRYWYRVNARNAIGPSGWSDSTFSVQESPEFAVGPTTWLPDESIAAGGLLLPGPYDRSEGGGVGFDVTGLVPRAKVYYAKWYMSDADGRMFLIPHDGGGLPGPVFEASVTLRSNAAEPHLCPGYRLLYANGAYSHQGAVVVLTPESRDGAPVSAPALDEDFEARAYWSAPADLEADAYAAAPAPGYYDDGRDYSFMFDLLHSDAGDTGLLSLESISIRSFTAPPPAQPDIEWDGAQGDFADWYGGLYAGESNDGTFAVVAGGAAMRLSAADTVSRGYELTYASATPLHPLVDASAGAMPFEPESLLRLTASVRSQDVNRSPVFRIATYVLPRAGGASRPMFWIDIFGASAPFVKRPGARQPDQTAPGAPSQAGSTVEVYRWTHGRLGYTAQAQDFVLPQIDVYSIDLYGRHQGEAFWPDDTGYLEFSRVAIEAIDAPDK